jgi:hypothetical protein
MALSHVGLTQLIPVLTSTASVTFCFTEYWTFIPFLHPEIPPQALSKFWSSYFYQSMPGVCTSPEYSISMFECFARFNARFE